MSVLLSLIAAAGILYTLASAYAVLRFRPVPAPVPGEAPAIVQLKPLHGAEPKLAENIGTFLRQDYPGPVRLVAGVADPDDPAVRAFAAARAANRDAPGVLIVNPARHGANGKIGNLINMDAAAGAAPIVVMSDSDMAAPRDYLQRIAAALEPKGVGAVTCLYRGRGDAGAWSEVAAAGVSYQFLPAVAMAVLLRVSWPCMGATIALRRETLNAIGGFAAFRDVLADDHAIGAAVRGLGLRLAYPPLILTHCHNEASFAQLARREVRSNVTVRTLDPAGYAGSFVTFPVPLALIGWAIHPAPFTLGMLGAALLARLALQLIVDRVSGASTAPKWWMPARDILSFGLYLAAFAVRAVDWRGSRLALKHGGEVELRRRPEHP